MPPTLHLPDPRRRLFGLGLAAAAASLAVGMVPGTAAAETAFPSKPVTIIVPFSPGGTTDLLARLIGQHLGSELGQTFVIDNRSGAGGNIGAQAAARAAPDGHTLFMGTVGTHAINASLYRNLPYDPVRDFAPLTRVAMVPNMLVVSPSVPFKTVPEMIAYAQAHPGKLMFGSPGNGSSPHISGELFKSMAKAKITHVPYRGSAPAMSDLLSGQIDVMFDNMPSALPHVKAGKLRALAVTPARRSSELPDLPTLAEAGVPGYEATSWFGLFAIAGTPPAVLSKLHAALAKVLAKPEVQKKIAEQGAEPYSEKPEEFAAFMQRESLKWGKVVREAGTVLD